MSMSEGSNRKSIFLSNFFKLLSNNNNTKKDANSITAFFKHLLLPGNLLLLLLSTTMRQISLTHFVNEETENTIAVTNINIIPDSPYDGKNNCDGKHSALPLHFRKP